MVCSCNGLFTISLSLSLSLSLCVCVVGANFLPPRDLEADAVTLEPCFACSSGPINISTPIPFGGYSHQTVWVSFFCS